MIWRRLRIGEIDADTTLFRQLLENLIANAFKYHHPECAPIDEIERLSSAVDSEALVVRDNGLGFDNAHKRTPFVPFKRLHTGYNIDVSSVGLATCQHICERHGWGIDAEGHVGHGAKFTIYGIDATQALRSD